MAIALIALLLIELLLLALWAPFFFRTGIALFNQRIAATPAELAQLSLAGLEHDLPPDTWLCLVFRALPDGSIAFRESFVPSVGRRYFPLMRGRVMIDARRREVRVIGLCSWFALGLTLILVPVILIRPAAWPMLVALVLFYIGYFIQRRRYVEVVEAVRARLRSEFPKRLVAASQ
ncbi:membrane protein [Stenotrophomonas maltophilia 5BA-I-2]|nr:membrane protein [Stenotrophomonas maltophilia 5BA-I-2]